ncbi:MAG: hypothetical protein NW214_01675 [Pseudanabaenaceae cyanobacterium bins.39]|nr:hypothetical protein [Pseudanabaenaceae cyanobacterium bins.39]
MTNRSVAIQSNDIQGELSEYVAHMQLHMALQARNLVPNLSGDRIQDSRSRMLTSTQADFERMASRL